jgi:hypothetical protein
MIINLALNILILRSLIYNLSENIIAYDYIMLFDANS